MRAQRKWIRQKYWNTRKIKLIYHRNFFSSQFSLSDQYLIVVAAAVASVECTMMALAKFNIYIIHNIQSKILLLLRRFACNERKKKPNAKQKRKNKIQERIITRRLIFARCSV